MDYPGWADYIEHLLSIHKITPSTFLELGAGTAKLAKYFSFTNKCQNFFSDLSFEMIQASKADGAKLVCDMKSIPFKQESMDLIILMYDAFNYLMTPRDVKIALNCIKESLKDGGYFLFDTTTENNCYTHFYDDFVHEEHEEFDYVCHSWFDENEKIQNNDFTFYRKLNDGTFSKIVEKHAQRVYTHSEIVGFIEEAELECIAAYSEFTTEVPHEESMRVHYLVKK